MNNFFEDLKHYFDVTPASIIHERWELTKEFDQVGPTIEEFLATTPRYQIVTSSRVEGQLLNENNNFSPEFTSGFLFNNNTNIYAKGSVFNN